MWHEARKQEKMIRGLIVDYRRRAERRRDFYEKIKADPTQFLQLHGRPCKIHLDPVIAAAGDSPAIMMPWQGDRDNMIDRFDARAHLDYIVDIKVPDVPPEEMTHEERYCNYERYRILAQNSFLGIGEEKFLHQLSIEEQFGVTIDEKEQQREKASEKKGTGVAIGYNYDDSTPAETQSASYPASGDKGEKSTNNDKDDSEDESDLEIVDVDLSIDVNKVEPTQAHAMNSCGTLFGMVGTDLFSFLTGDAQDAEKQKLQIREEKEKAMFSGRKSRRERRAHREKKLSQRVVSPPHYASRSSLVGPAWPPRSPQRSPSPPETHSEAITFITSFGGDDEPTDNDKSFTGKITYADKVKMNQEKSYATVVREGPKKPVKRLASPKPQLPKKPASPNDRYSPSDRFRRSRSSGSSSRSKERSPRRSSRSKDSSRSSSHSRSNDRSVSRDRSRSKQNSRSRRSSRSNSRSSYRSRSRSSSDRSSLRKGYSSKSGTAGRSGSGHHPNTSTSSAPRPPRYYGRKRDGRQSSSSQLSMDSDEEDKYKTTDKSNDNVSGGNTSHVSNTNRNSGTSSKVIIQSNPGKPVPEGAAQEKNAGAIIKAAAG